MAVHWTGLLVSTGLEYSDWITGLQYSTVAILHNHDPTLLYIITLPCLIIVKATTVQ